ncbi:CD276 antigen-like [Anguilla anguilla]|uniref:CD276 antigen-like n=1 Tax=Anguilla anguilla TaxID=7936 RepID=UPI0015AAAFF5|nr:CD276 antigen-like [Anguilla anguilla]XP_035274009.1 CD276 antigen-like [Anguilla anguilla]XP_035274010.1 CD276 antigen-like [Anguilla anguilla]XP_035274011.1 CD276 antigen-like [Anguilla anguilla]XP_035274012.1 CD276 antigen-like [Anguilla anguilla]
MDLPCHRVCMLALLMPTLLALSAYAVLEVQVPEMPVVALYGQDAVLNCSFAPPGPFNLSDLSIFWQLTDSKRTVHGYWDDRDQLADQVEAFANRTGLFRAELGSGNASLLLRGVRVADDGSFTCFVRVREYGSAALLVQVAAPYSKPQVTWEADSNLRPGDVVSLSCAAHGGYPEARVTWQDGAGRNLTDNVTVSQVANEEGLFSVRSVLTVMAEPNSAYNCTLVNPLLGAEGHASASIEAPSVTGLNMAFPPVALWVTVGLAICLLGLLIALAVICGRKICEEIKKGKEGKELEEDESKTAMTPLKS